MPFYAKFYFTRVKIYFIPHQPEAMVIGHLGDGYLGDGHLGEILARTFRRQG